MSYAVIGVVTWYQASRPPEQAMWHLLIITIVGWGLGLISEMVMPERARVSLSFLRIVS